MLQALWTLLLLLLLRLMLSCFITHNHNLERQKENSFIKRKIVVMLPHPLLCSPESPNRKNVMRATFCTFARNCAVKKPFKLLNALTMSYRRKVRFCCYQLVCVKRNFWQISKATSDAIQLFVSRRVTIKDLRADI